MLASPLEEEKGVLDSLSGSASNDILGQSSTVHMPSFASEGDEVILNGKGNKFVEKKFVHYYPRFSKMPWHFCGE